MEEEGLATKDLRTTLRIWLVENDLRECRRLPGEWRAIRHGTGEPDVVEHRLKDGNLKLAVWWRASKYLLVVDVNRFAGRLGKNKSHHISAHKKDKVVGGTKYERIAMVAHCGGTKDAGHYWTCAGGTDDAGRPRVTVYNDGEVTTVAGWPDMNMKSYVHIDRRIEDPPQEAEEDDPMEGETEDGDSDCLGLSDDESPPGGALP